MRNMISNTVYVVQELHAFSFNEIAFKVLL